MVADDLLQHVPHLGLEALDGSFGGLDVDGEPWLTSRFDDKGLESSSAISLGRPHWYSCSVGPTTMTERPE
jgi:hypothetical protein